MADTQDEIRAALQEAQRAQEEADRLRKEARAEAERMKDEARRARDEARRLRDLAREQARRDRQHGPRGPIPPRSPGSREQAAPAAGVRTEHTFSLEGITHVQIDQTAGKLLIRPCQEGETEGIVAIGNKATPEILVTRDGARLTIEVKLTKGWIFRRKQGSNTTVRLSAQQFQQLKVDNGYGETEVQGMHAADLRVDVGAGSIQCLFTRGKLNVNVGAGKVAVLSHAGLAECDSGTGDVLLDVAEVFEGEYKVDVGLGRAEVRLPAGAAVFIKAASGIGKSRVEYPSAPDNAATRLRINSGIGECVVKARDAVAATTELVTPAGPPRPQRGSRVAAASARRREAEEMRVLQLLEQGKITPQDAADLIAALQGSSAPSFDSEDEGDTPVFN